MIKKIQSVFVCLFVFSCSTTLMGNETAQTYFPGTFGSYWVYQDQDGEVSPLEQHQANDPPGESVTILWLAPNIGIVKGHQETEDILLKTIPSPEFQSSATVKTFELKKYEIKSEASDSNESD